MSRDYLLFLEDMQIACRKLLRYTESLTFDRLVEDERTYDAVIYNLVILGEAAKQISPSIRDLYPRVQWRKIAGLRDISVHRYFGLDEDVLWDILQREIQPLLAQIDRILDEEA